LRSGSKQSKQPLQTRGWGHRHRGRAALEKKHLKAHDANAYPTVLPPIPVPTTTTSHVDAAGSAGLKASQSKKLEDLSPVSSGLACLGSGVIVMVHPSETNGTAVSGFQYTCEFHSDNLNSSPKPIAHRASTLLEHQELDGLRLRYICFAFVD
jgi:hypothetical protein